MKKETKHKKSIYSHVGSLKDSSLELKVTKDNATLIFTGGITIKVKNTNALYVNPCSQLMILHNKMEAKKATTEEIDAFDSLMTATKYLFTLAQTAFYDVDSITRMFKFALDESEHYIESIERDNVDESKNLDYMKQLDIIFNN